MMLMMILILATTLRAKHVNGCCDNVNDPFSLYAKPAKLPQSSSYILSTLFSILANIMK
jgi:hypothetical protein